MPAISRTVRTGRGASLLLLAGIAIYATAVLAGSPCRGVADNLDFFRVTRPAGIEPVAPAAVPEVSRSVRCDAFLKTNPASRLGIVGVYNFRWIDTGPRTVRSSRS